MKTKFPNAIAAVEERQKHITGTEKVTVGSSLWKIGDGLVADIRKSSLKNSRTANKINTNVSAQLKECADELHARGYGKPYTVGFLAMLLDVAEAFPRAKRRPGLSANLHIEAGSVAIMDWIFKCAAQEHVAEKDIGLFYIRARRKAWAEKFERVRKEKHEEAKTKQQEASEKKRKAKTVTEKIAAEQEEQAAEKEAEATANPPAKRDLPAPTAEETPVVLKELDLMGFSYRAREIAHEAKRLAEEASAAINPVMMNVSRAFIEAAAESALEAANELQVAAQAWRNVSDVVRKTSSNKRGHLSAVGE